MSVEKKSSEAPRKKVGTKKKKESPKTEVKAEEERKEEQVKEDIPVVTGAEPTETYSSTERAEIKSAFSPCSDVRSFFSVDSLLKLGEKAKSRIQAQIQMVKSMYSLFQGMKQSYGGDTKKVLSVIFSFAKEEAKRRINETKSKLRKKIIGELD